VNATESQAGRVTLEDVAFSYTTNGSGGSPYGPAPARQAAPGTAAVLRQVDLEIAPGTLTLLCGASGSGKSSILRLINGLIPHFHSGSLHGRVEVGGVDMPRAALADSGRVTSTVFQNPRTQFFTSDVRGELAFRGENYGVDPGEIERRIRRAAGQLGISHLLGRRLSQLSGGELQRVACAQALVAGTPVILLDEPTSNLSPQAVQDMTGILARLKADGHTIVVAEHRLHFLRGLADQVVLVREGRIARRWTGEEFFALGDAERRDLGLRTLETPPACDAVPLRAHAGDDAQTPPSSARGLVLEDVRFSYGRRRVLDIDRLGFPAGCVSALVGVNGAGKSTLARILCGLADPERGGRIALDGRRAGTRARLASSSLVMQDVHRQLFSASVRSEVVLGLDPGRAREVDVDALLAGFDLAAESERHPLSLSGGQKQRLAIAAAIAKGARLHILDEPTSGVDHRRLEAIAAALRSLARGGAIVIVITHDAELIEACADRIVKLRRLDPGGAASPQAEVIRPPAATATRRIADAAGRRKDA
jgi:energy-coupling factor transport system ATP-binding protein